MSRSTPTNVRNSDPTPFLGTRTENDLEIGPSRNRLRSSCRSPPSFCTGDQIETVSVPAISRLLYEFTGSDDVGNGNFGSVTLRSHELDDCLYAIKKVSDVVQGDADLQHRLQEVYALSACSGRGTSPYILRYHDSWIEDDGFVCIRTEYLNGGNLRSLCVRKQQTPEEQEPVCLSYPPTNPLISSFSFPLVDPCRVWEFLFQMSMGLHSIHTNNNLAHLDVKPDNIFVAVPNRSLPKHHHPSNKHDFISVCYKLGDFGLARTLVSHSQEQYKGLNDDEGDKRYLCPYLLGGTQPPKLKEADVYSLGASVLEIIGCKPAPTASHDQIVCLILKVFFPQGSIKNTCEELAHLVASMVSHNPDLRPTTLLVAMKSFVNMQLLRESRGIAGPMPLPPEVQLAASLKGEIAEAEEQLKQLSIDFGCDSQIEN